MVESEALREIAESTIGINTEKFYERLEQVIAELREQVNNTEGLANTVARVELLNAQVAKQASRLKPTVAGTAMSNIGIGVWSSAISR